MVRLRLALVAGFVMLLSLVWTAPAGAQTATILYTRMTGAQETPPNSSRGIGDAIVFVYPNNTVCTVLRVHGLSTPVVGAHIHQAPPGVPGPIVIPLQNPVNGFSYTCSQVSSDLAAQLRNNPGAFYANVHTTNIPGGEIRGQLFRI